MSISVRIPIISALVGGCIIYGVSQMPPLTNSASSQASRGTSTAEVEAMQAAERAFCEAQPEALDCRCFAKRSGAVLSHNEPQVPGAFYADQTDLARGQAGRSC